MFFSIQLRLWRMCSQTAEDGLPWKSDCKPLFLLVLLLTLLRYNTMVISKNLAHIPRPGLYSRQMRVIPYSCFSLKLISQLLEQIDWHTFHCLMCVLLSVAWQKMFTHSLLKSFVVWTGETSVLWQEYSSMAEFCLWRDAGLEIIFAGSCRRLYQWGLKFSTVLWVCCLGAFPVSLWINSILNKSSCEWLPCCDFGEHEN